MTTDAPYTRIWDADLNELYNSQTDSRTPEQFLLDQGLTEAHYTVDFPPNGGWRTREAGRLVKNAAGEVWRFPRRPL